MNQTKIQTEFQIYFSIKMNSLEKVFKNKFLQVFKCFYFLILFSFISKPFSNAFSKSF